MRVVHPKGGNVRFDPDYLCFISYSYLALSHIAKSYADAEKVDFIIERNGRITKYIQAFHFGFATSLAAIGRSDLSRLVGELIPAGKDRIPLQAADVLCWHTARSKDFMDEADLRRYAKIASKIGMRATLDGTHLKELAILLTTAP